MFSQKQIDELNAPLSSKHVKNRSQAGRSLSYIEGWHAISEANRIFGFGKWSRRTEELKLLGEPYQTEKKDNAGKFLYHLWNVNYMARVRIDVVGDTSEDKWDGVTREGCGFGQGIDRDLGKAHESALKEAETDAMKRGLMTFGNPFGLALYDKEQNGVADEPPPKTSPTIIKAFIMAIEKADTLKELQAWWKEHASQITSFDDDAERQITDAKDKRKAELMKKEAA